MYSRFALRCGGGASACAGGENVSRRLSTEVSMAGRNGRNGTRVVVTGMGAITPIGNSVKEFWASCLAGKSGIGILTSFDHSAYPIHIAGEIKNFDPEEHMDRRDARRMARFSQLAIAATQEAIKHAELEMDEVERTRVGVLIGNGIGGLVEPQEASRPFDAERDGFVASEAAGIFVLENLEHARRRNAPILAELAGYGAGNDAYHVVAPSENGEGAANAMRWALEDSGVEPAQVDYVNAHGTSTKLNDASETLAIKRVFGEDAYRVPISATKSMIGHSFGAAGAVESVAAVQTIQTGMIHPTINYEHPDPECDLDYVPNKARRADVDIVLKNSFGFGGQNACLVFKRYEG